MGECTALLSVVGLSKSASMDMEWYACLFGENVELFWQNVGLFWQNVGLFWENVGLFWQNVGLFWQNVGLFWERVGQLGECRTRLSRVGSFQKVIYK